LKDHLNDLSNLCDHGIGLSCYPLRYAGI